MEYQQVIGIVLILGEFESLDFWNIVLLLWIPLRGLLKVFAPKVYANLSHPVSLLMLLSWLIRERDC